MKKPRLLIFCQYVRGIGHLVRSNALARSLCESFEVCLLNGGEPVLDYDLPLVQYVAIPPISRDDTSGKLYSVDKSLTLSECSSRRRELIEETVGRFIPDIVITEHFPFGLLFKDDYLTLLMASRRANQLSRLVCSVRDVVLSPGGTNDDNLACQLLNDWFDLILAHGDESILRIEESVPLISTITTPIRYTGYVVGDDIHACFQKASQSHHNSLPKIVASVGGGRVGGDLLTAMVEASRLLASDWPHVLKVFTGQFLPRDLADQIHELTRYAPWVETYEFTPSFRSELMSATVAVGLGGYNTLIESVASGVPTIVYLHPFRHGDREQEFRASRFSKAKLVETLKPYELAPEVLARRIRYMAEQPMLPRQSVRLDGAKASRQIIEQLFGQCNRPNRPNV